MSCLYLIGFVTCASRREARRLADMILAARLAACVNILNGLESHYWWRGRREQSAEWLLLIKTTRPHVVALQRLIRAEHSYDCPEIVFIPIVAGAPAYLKWLRAAVAGFTGILLAGTGLADPVDDAIRQLEGPTEEVRVEAADRIAELGGPRAVEQFRKMIASANPEQRQIGAIGLAQVSDADEDLERLRRALMDKESEVRWSAAFALGRTGRVEAMAWLTSVAHEDAAESVRELAREALTRLQAGVLWTSVAKALASRQPVLLYFRVAGTEYCRQFEEGSLADPGVVKASRSYACARVDATMEAAWVKYAVKGAPTLVVLDADGREQGRVAGVATPSVVAERLTAGVTTYENAVMAAWRQAQAHLEAGREDSAVPLLQRVLAWDEANRHGHTPAALLAFGYAQGKRGHHAGAVAAMEQLLRRWPDFKDNDKALYCLGLSRLALGRTADGRAALEQLVREYPQSEAVPSAREALARLRN